MTEREQLTLESLAERIASLSTQIQQQHTQSTTGSESDVTIDCLKKALYEAAQDIQTFVVGPKITLRALYGTHYDLAAHQIALEFDFFGRIPLEGRIAAEELAKATGLSHDVVSRVLRLLATQKIFQEVAENEFSHTMLSAIVAEDNDLKASFHMQMDELLQAAADTASYLREDSSEMDDMHCPFTKRHQVPILQYYIQNSEKGKRFGRAMAGATKLDRNVNALRDLYDWDSLGDGLVVDVGGADGAVSLLLAESFPRLSFLVQDNNRTLISQGTSQLASEYVPRVTFQEYDFFTPQTATNASLFFIRQCLHNWPDSACVAILRAFVPALEVCKKETVLLINESVVPKPGDLPRLDERLVRQVDMSMLINCGSRQRTEDDFRRLVKEADARLDVVKVHSVGSMGLLEVQLVR